MSKLEEIKNHHKLRRYFKDKLEMDDDEFERRFQMYLEIFPFIALDFRLKSDCHFVHKSAKIIVNNTEGHNHQSRIATTVESEPTYARKAEEYRAELIKIRESIMNIEIEINENGF